MQIKNNNQERGNMTQKIRMNTELRNKLFNKIKHVFENEDTQERESISSSKRRSVDININMQVNLQKKLLREHIHQMMLQHLRTFKKKYGSPCDVVAKDKCFYFAHNEDVDDEGETKKLNHILILVCLAI